MSYLVSVVLEHWVGYCNPLSEVCPGGRVNRHANTGSSVHLLEVDGLVGAGYVRIWSYTCLHLCQPEGMEL